MRLRERVVRLTKKEAHWNSHAATAPHDQQRAHHGNSGWRRRRLLQLHHHRAKRRVDTYYGKHLYRIDRTASPWKIKSKRSVLGMDMLYPGKLTIIV
jgi:3-phenylpropionate/cinnamic acid dioxygenase small subunit